MNHIKADQSLIARCGLYCGACKKYLKGACPGCTLNVKASWCGVRACCLERSLASCADCADFTDALACKTYNNFISRFIGLVLRSDRHACIRQIKRLGYAAHAADMAEHARVTLKRT
jgi:hypothetical protein